MRKADGRHNERLSTSWRDVISYSPRGIPCFVGTLLIRRTAALPCCAKRRSFHPPTEEIRYGHSRLHRPPIRIRTIGPDPPGTAPRRQFPGAYGRPHAADRARGL